MVQTRVEQFMKHLSADTHTILPIIQDDDFNGYPMYRMADDVTPFTTLGAPSGFRSNRPVAEPCTRFSQSTIVERLLHAHQRGPNLVLVDVDDMRTMHGDSDPPTLVSVGNPPALGGRHQMGTGRRRDGSVRQTIKTLVSNERGETGSATFFFCH